MKRYSGVLQFVKRERFKNRSLCETGLVNPVGNLSSVAHDEGFLKH